MSVENIKAFSIIGRTDALDRVVFTLGESGSFQPDEVSNFYSNTRDFNRASGSNPFTEPLARITNAMSIFDIRPQYVRINHKKFDPDYVTINEYSEKLLKKAEKYKSLQSDAQFKYNECKRAIEETSHFVELNQNIEELLKMEYVKAVFGRLPKESMNKLGAENFDSDYIEFIPCSEEGTYIWGVYFAPVTQLDKAKRMFSRLYFEESSFAEMDDKPAKQYEQLKKEEKELSEALEQINNKIEEYSSAKKKKILRYYTKVSEYNLYFSIKTHTLVRGDSFILTGWVPENSADKLKKKLESIESVEVDVSKGTDELKLSPPVKLKNPFLFRPFQFYTEMYGVPKYGELDPTGFVAITYVLLFGMMFGDVGHGIVVAIAGLLMWYIRRMPIGKILIPCGVSGACFGILYGSVFGFENGMDWLYKDILHMSEKPIEVMAPEATNLILYTTIGLGMLLLCVAIILNIYSSLRQGKIGVALFDTNGLAGLTFYGMICAGMIGMIVFGANLFTLPFIILLIVMFMLIFFREPLGKLVEGKPDWKPESFGGYVMENAFESLEVLLSYATNTMSFLRVAGFILVHAGMMQVVFTLAEVAGTIGYIPVVVIGNALVCVLEALLVSIQALRLEYYEMFSRFYSGEGRPYEPVKLSLTKN